VRQDNTYADVKDILETWRLRLPNEWDSLLHWQDVLVWRNTVYNVVISVSQTWTCALIGV
jgi:transformation/transcription domain-associated protein